MAHPSEHASPSRPLSRVEAVELAETLQAFSTASRLGLLWELLDGERPVDELARAVDLSPSAASHQLKILRQSRLVSSRRDGRRMYYRLHDHHLPDLLAAMRHHHEHALHAPVTEHADAAATRSASGD